MAEVAELASREVACVVEPISVVGDGMVDEGAVMLMIVVGVFNVSLLGKCFEGCENW